MNEGIAKILFVTFFFVLGVLDAVLRFKEEKHRCKRSKKYYYNKGVVVDECVLKEKHSGECYLKERRINYR